MEKERLSRSKRSQKDYPLGFKISIVDRIECGQMTYKQAQAHYGIQGRSTVLVWLRKHGTLDWSNPKYLPMSSAGKETPAQKIMRLEKELEDEKIRCMLLNRMIDIADEQYGTSIRKKLSTQQSEASKKKDK